MAPRDSRRRPVKGATIRRHCKGEGVKMDCQRKTPINIIGLTPAERKAFAADPKVFLKAHEK